MSGRLLLLSLLLLPPFAGAPAARAEDAAAAALERDLARELEREMASDRELEREAFEARGGPRAGIACVESESQLQTIGGDVIRYRKLTRDDFLAERDMSTKRDRAVHIPGAVVGAHVGLMVACVHGALRLEQRADGMWEAWFDDVRFYALLDRTRSWWNPRAQGHPEWILRHEQLHFDLAELVARRHNAADEAGRVAAGVGATDQEALAASDRFWRERIDALWQEFREIERQYDLETRHGTVAREQTRWFEKTLRELAATRHLANR